MHVNIAHVRADIYARQSKDRLQGIRTQVDDCTDLCRLRGWEVAETIADNDVSASDGKLRPGFARLLQRIDRRDMDLIVVTHIDRLLRKLAELEDMIERCEKAGVRIATVSGDLDLSTDAGRLVGRILAVIARGEVERKSARQKRANKQAAEQGRARRGSPRPFGWLDDRISPALDEAAAIRDGCDAVLAGGTLLGVTRDWERRGLRPHQAPYGPLREHPWTRTSVKEILANPRNAGIATYRGAQVGHGEWIPLVREETWLAVQEIIRTPRFRRAAHFSSLLGGIAFCRCGNQVTGGRSAQGHPSYRCNLETRNYRPGPHVNVKRAGPDAYVSMAVIDALSAPDAIHLLAPRPQGGDAGILKDEAANLRLRLGRLGELYADGKITEADLVSGRDRGEARLAEIEVELVSLGRGNILAPVITAGDVAAKWEMLGIDLKRAVVDTLMTVTLHPSGSGARTFDPGKVLPPGQGIVWKGSSR